MFSSHTVVMKTLKSSLLPQSELHVWGLDLSEEAGECLSSKRKNSWSRFSGYEHHEEDIVPSFNMDDDTFCWTSLWVLSAGLTLTAQKAQMFPTPMIHVWKKIICILWKYCLWLNIFIGNLGLNELGSSAEKQKCHVWIQVVILRSRGNHELIRNTICSVLSRYLPPPRQR